MKRYVNSYAGLKMPGTYESTYVPMINSFTIGKIEKLSALAGETVPADLADYTAKQAAELQLQLGLKTQHLRRRLIQTYRLNEIVEPNTAWLIERQCIRIGEHVPANLYGMTENQAEDFRLSLCRIEYLRSQDKKGETEGSMSTSSFANFAGIQLYQAADLLEWAGIEKVREIGHGRIIWHYRSCINLAYWLFDQDAEQVAA